MEKYNLGYACLSVKLREKDIFMSRTCRLETIKNKGIEFAKELAIKNLDDLALMLKYNVSKKILLFRLSSEIFPFATHPQYGYDIKFAKQTLKTLGEYAKNNKMRLTFHPAQYVILSSNNPRIVKHSIEDLKLHADILDMMGLDQNSIMIIHGGGVYGDKPKSIKRLIKNIKACPKKVRDRLVIENCEMAYTVEDLLPISKELLIPIVIDFHHDEINPSSKPVSTYLNSIFKIWDLRKIKPKIHISNSIPGITSENNKTERRKHSDYIYRLQPGFLDINRNVDVMVEAKQKELAIPPLKKIIQKIQLLNIKKK